MELFLRAGLGLASGISIGLRGIGARPERRGTMSCSSILSSSSDIRITEKNGEVIFEILNG